MDRNTSEIKPLQALVGLCIMVVIAILVGSICIAVFATLDEDEQLPAAPTSTNTPLIATPIPASTTISTVIPTTAPTIQPPAPPVGFATATPFPTHTPSASGLGVSRSTLVNLYERLDIGFEFWDSTYGNETPQYLGFTEEYEAYIELVGPAHNLTEANALVQLSPDPDKSVVIGAIMLGLLTTVIEWDGGADWLIDSLSTIDFTGTVTKSYDGYRIHLEYLEWGGVAMDITRP